MALPTPKALRSKGRKPDGRPSSRRTATLVPARYRPIPSANSGARKGLAYSGDSSIARCQAARSEAFSSSTLWIVTSTSDHPPFHRLRE